MTFTTRPYQQAAIDASIAYLQNPKLKNRNGLVIAPTGSGKSLVIAGIATRLDGPSVVLQPSKEILEQNLAKLAHYGHRAAVFSASLDRREVGRITLATVGTVVKHPEAFAHVRYLIVDECHTVNAQGGQYLEFAESVGARILGLTATPYRLASNSMGSQLRFLTRTRPRVFRDVVHHTQIGDLFRDGYLCPLRYETRTAIDRAKLRLNSSGADYRDDGLQRHLIETGFVGKLQEEVERAFAGGAKNCLIFTRYVHESERLAAAVPGVAVVTADTPAGERARILADFRRGTIRGVANVGIIALGFDYPELEYVILGRPSISLALYYQQVGRVLRPHPAKPHATVVDMVGLVEQFGKVEDLVVRPGGTRGEQWVIASGGRSLTNTYFGELLGLSPQEIAKANARRKFWARRTSGG